jgi:hypothetical protein
VRRGREDAVGKRRVNCPKKEKEDISSGIATTY